MIALVRYALFSCPVDGGINLVDGTTASRAMIENLNKRLENNSQITESDLQFMKAILDYTLFACSVDSGVDIGEGITADRQMIEALKGRVAKVLASKAQAPKGPTGILTETGTSASKSVEVQNELEIHDGDLKALIAILDYSLFTCPDEGIDVVDEGTATRETIEKLKQQLEEILAARHIGPNRS